MPSYVNRGVKMFAKGDGRAITQKRSEGRMKRYDSCSDLRAWCDNDEERRRYMLELMCNPPTGGGGGSCGKYIPIQTLIEMVQALKDSQMQEMRKRIDELEKELAAYRKLKLTDEQRAQLEGMMGGVQKAKKDMDKADSTTVLFKRKGDEGHSSGADSDSENDLRQLLAERDAQIKSLKDQLNAKNEEIAAKDKAMKSAKDKVDGISDKVDDNSQLRAQLDKTKAELDSLRAQYDELKRKSSNCDDILAERDALRMRVKDYENMDEELEKLRYRAKEADVLRMERDRLKERVDELSTIETAYMKLLQETSDYEQLAAERELYKTKYEELAGSGQDLAAMDDELKHLQGIEQERDYLLRELNELRCTIADQEDEIQRLLIMVEKLSAGNNNKEERMAKGLSSMRLEMDNRDKRIAELEAQLADLPNLEEEIRSLREQLKNTIVTVAQDKDMLSTSQTQLRNELTETGKLLEGARQEIDEYMAQLAALQRENDSLRSQIESLRAASGGDSELQDELVRERNLRAQAEEALRQALDNLEKSEAEKDKAMAGMAAKTSGSKELLEHSESKYLREKEAKDLLQGVLDVTQDELENERATRRNLEERIKELEALLANNAKAADSNRKLSLDMNNEIEQLRAQLEAEKKKCEELMKQNRASRTSIASHDSKNAKIQAEANEKIQALQKRVNELEAENASLRNQQDSREDGAGESDALKKRVSELEAENASLKSQLASAKDGAGAPDENIALNDRIKQLEKQVQELQAENDRLKSVAAAGPVGAKEGSDLVDVNRALEVKIKELLATVDGLQAENAALKNAAKAAVKNDDCSDLMAAAQAEKAQMDAIIKKLEAQLKAAEQSEAGGSNAELESLRKKCADLEAQNKKLASTCDGDDVADCAMDCGNALEKFKQKIFKLEAENQKLKGENQKLQAQVDSKAPADTRDELDSLRKKISCLEAENDKLKSENDKLKSAGGSSSAQADCEKELENLRKIVGSLEAENKALKSSDGSSKAQADCEKELESLRKAIASLEAENKTLKLSAAAPADKDNRLAELEKELESLRNKCKSLEAENEKLKSLGGKDTTALANAGTELENLSAQYAKLEAENKRLQALLDSNAPPDARGELEKLRERIRSLEAENEKLKASAGKDAGATSELDELKKKLAKFEQENKALQSAIDSKAPADSRKELEELRKKISSLEAEIERLNRDKKDLSEKAAKLSKSFEDRLANMTRASLLKIQKSVDKFKETLSPVDHMENIKNTEDKYEKRLAALKEEYEKRLADMMEQNRKNTEGYSANLASLKEIYERDMKALNERHNESVLRLQNLHEQEIREINDNYEKELMNVENSHDGSLTEVRKQSRDSIKNLNAKHESELEKLRKQYEDMINKMTKEHNEEKERMAKKLSMDLKERDNKLRELEEKGQVDKSAEKEKSGGKEVERKTEIEKKDELIKGDSAEETRLKYEAMLNRLTDSHDKKMQLLKDRYEQLLEEERRKNAKAPPQLQQMKTDVHEVKPESGAMPVAMREGDKSSDTLIAILNKILASGIESLTFEELSFLHECICAASGKKILSNPNLKLSVMSPELHGMDKKELCSRVAILEKELTRRDKETQRKVCCLEKCVLTEKRRCEEARQTLAKEQRRCVELGSQHDMMKKETANCTDRANCVQRELEKERAKIRAMDCELSKVKCANKHLQTLLENERQRVVPCGGKESDIVASLRMKLEAVIENESKLRCQLEKMETFHHRTQVPTKQPAPVRKPATGPPAAATPPGDRRLGFEPSKPVALQEPPMPRRTCLAPCNVPTPRVCQGPCNIPSARQPSPTARLSPTPRVCPPPCNDTSARYPSQMPCAGIPQPPAEQPSPRRPGPATCAGNKPYTDVQVLTQRDTFMNACSARLASKKPKK